MAAHVLNKAASYDDAWDEPLPHSVSPRKEYLRRALSGRWKGERRPQAAVVFVHGRGDNIDDMVGVFLPVLARRFGGHEGVLPPIEDGNGDDVNEDAQQASPVALVGLEARDNIWYPQSHNVVGEEALINDVYQHSALEKLRTTLVELVYTAQIPVEHIVLVGFSQGAMMANNYVLAALTATASHSRGDSDKKGSASQSASTGAHMPIPGHIFALSGSLFKTQPTFPERRYGSPVDEATHRAALEAELRLVAATASSSEADKTRATAVSLCPQTVVLRLLCGNSDRFFKPDEIHAAAATLVDAAKAAAASAPPSSAASAVAHALQVNVGMEPNAPHQITGRMIAALVATLDEIVVKGGADAHIEAQQQQQ